ncbi:MAG TPA: MmgE/PrpD family protein [Alphaproteobacteria bacterium]|jgi:2-methylcitrate dehydratase PrpD
MSANAQTALADWCAALEWRSVPAEQRALVPLRVLDTLGLIAAGAGTDAVRAVAEFGADEDGIGTATLYISSRRMSASRCALVHGVAAHCRDFDDTFPDSVVHPGSVVVPAALAAGETAGAAPADIAAAIVAGYEIAARIGGAAGRRFHARGLHATGVVGPIAVAAAAARARRLSAEHTAWAMGLAASMAGGLMAFQADGAWSKWLHAGWAAQGGIVAADLAGRGFQGPLAALDGPANLFAAMLAGETVDISALTAGLGREWRGGGARFKYYPCAHVIQPYIDAALKLRRDRALAAADIAEVRCAIAPWAVPIVCEPRAQRVAPATELDAIASLPYMVAHALKIGAVGLDALAPAARARADLRDLALRIFHDADPTLGHGFDARVTLRMRDGRTLTATADAAALDRKRLAAKFVANVAPILGAQPARDAALRLSAMEAPDPAAIAGLFGAR